MQRHWAHGLLWELVKGLIWELIWKSMWKINRVGGGD